MLKSSLCDYSDVCILVKGTVTSARADVDADAKNKQVVLENCTPGEINNTQVDNGKYLDIMMLSTAIIM